MNPSYSQSFRNNNTNNIRTFDGKNILPKIYNNTYENNLIQISDNNDTLKQNGGNIIMKDFGNFTPSHKGTRGFSEDRNLSTTNTNITTFMYETKMNELESKILSLENANQSLLERLANNEKNMQVQIQELKFKNMEDETKREKHAKTLAILNDQNNISTLEIRKKLNTLEEEFLKEGSKKESQRLQDVAMYKDLVSSVTAQVAEGVRKEIETRLKGDLDNRLFTQNLTGRFETELQRIRSELDEAIKMNRIEVKNLSRECSERAHNISKYIDQQLNDITLGKGTGGHINSNDNLKNFVQKLTEQIKQNLISQGQQNKIFDMRQGKLENSIDGIKATTLELIEKSESRLSSRVTEMRHFLEMNVQKHDEYLGEVLKEFSYKIDSNIRFLAGQLLETRKSINDKFFEVESKSSERFKAICGDMEEICRRIYKYEDNLVKNEKESKELRFLLEKDISTLKSEYEVKSVNERLIHTIECNMLQEQISALFSGIQKSNEQFNLLLTDMNNGSSNSFLNLSERCNGLQSLINTVAEKSYDLFDTLNKDKDKIEVSLLVHEMITKIESDYILEELQNNRNTNMNQNNKLLEHNNNIVSSINEINKNKENIEKLKDGLEKLNSSSASNMHNIDIEMKRMQEVQKEVQMRNDVRTILDDIVINVDKAINLEKQIRDNRINAGQISDSISRIQNQLNTHLDMNEKEFNIINDKIKDIETKNKEFNDNKNKSNTTINDEEINKIYVKIAMDNMYNNVEFKNIYSIINSSNGVQITGSEFDANYADIVDNKINNALEKIKNDNENMWQNAIEMTQKMNNPDEIREIIKKVPPVITPAVESKRRLLDIDYYENKSPKPLVPELTKNLKEIEANPPKPYNEDKESKDPGPITDNIDKKDEIKLDLSMKQNESKVTSKKTSKNASKNNTKTGFNKESLKNSQENSENNNSLRESKEVSPKSSGLNFSKSSANEKSDNKDNKDANRNSDKVSDKTSSKKDNSIQSKNTSKTPSGKASNNQSKASSKEQSKANSKRQSKGKNSELEKVDEESDLIEETLGHDEGKEKESDIKDDVKDNDANNNEEEEGEEVEEEEEEESEEGEGSADEERGKLKKATKHSGKELPK